MIDFTLSQLRFLCAVAEEGGVAAAARRMNCVPSNITARLKELEAGLGKTLFVRDRNRLHLSPEGRAFYGEARAIVDRTYELANLFADQRPRGVLNVAALDVALFDYLATRIPSFIRAFPQIELKILCRPTFAIERMLADGEVDLAVTDGPVVHPTLESRRAFAEELCVAVPAGSPAIGPDMPQDQHVFLFDVDCFYRSYFEAWLQSRGVTDPRVMTIESYAVMLECVAAGLGIACLPTSILEGSKEPPSGVAFLHPDDLGPCDVYFLWRSGHDGEALTAFLDAMADEAAGRGTGTESPPHTPT